MPTHPTLPGPYTEAPNASADEQDAFDAAIGAFITHLVLYDLTPAATPAQLFAPFAAPAHQPLLFYSACAHLLRVTCELSDAGSHLALLAALFGLLKEEGLRRDGPGGQGAFGNAIVFPAVRALLRCALISPRLILMLMTAPQRHPRASGLHVRLRRIRTRPLFLPRIPRLSHGPRRIRPCSLRPPPPLVPHRTPRVFLNPLCPRVVLPPLPPGTHPPSCS